MNDEPLPPDLATPRDTERVRYLANVVVAGALMVLCGALLAWALLL